MSLSSPGHAVSLSRGARFGKHVGCEVVGRGLARHDAQTQLKVHFEATAGTNCIPKLKKHFFLEVLDAMSKATMLICDLAESEEALGWKLWFRHQK